MNLGSVTPGVGSPEETGMGDGDVYGVILHLRWSRPLPLKNLVPRAASRSYHGPCDIRELFINEYCV